MRLELPDTIDVGRLFAVIARELHAQQHRVTGTRHRGELTLVARPSARPLRPVLRVTAPAGTHPNVIPITHAHAARAGGTRPRAA